MRLAVKLTEIISKLYKSVEKLPGAFIRIYHNLLEKEKGTCYDILCIGGDIL